MTKNANQVTVLMLVATSVAGDSRVLREAESLVRAGFSVEIVGKEVPADFDAPIGIKVHSSSSGHGLRPTSMSSLRTKKLAPHMRFVRWMLLPTHRAKSFKAWADGSYKLASTLDFDIVHAHDFTALEIGARLSRERKVPLIYDSHEWWLGRQRQYRPTPFTDGREARLERKLVQQASAVITVGKSIGDLMRLQREAKNVRVVRNSFPKTSDTSSLVTTPPKGVIYAGRVDAFRELETIIYASKTVSISITWMGDYANQWATQWVPIARASGIEVLPSQSLSAVTTAMQNAGLAFVTHSDQFESHRLALPNKLFHAVQAGVPVIATNVSELAGVVREFDLGELYEAGNAESMQKAIERAIDRHSDLVSNVNAAKGAMSWETDEKVLVQIYQDLIKAKL
ncbi:MAG: glycosyltransferase [Actinobacteria bacterium]|nr:glycosyltransferase [Actinomycetota bacterium]